MNEERAGWKRSASALLSALGGLTVVLVIVGAAGTVAYGVSRRRREIGVRLALGARRAQVAGATTRSALVSMTAGVLAGIVGAAAFGRFASAFLYGIEPTDAASLAARRRRPRAGDRRRLVPARVASRRHRSGRDPQSRVDGGGERPCLWSLALAR